MKKIRNITFSILFFLMLLGGGLWLLVSNGLIHIHSIDQYLLEREYEQALEKDFKILVLGDSQLEKWPIEHCLSTDLKEYFSDRNIGYVNAAHYGFGPIEYLEEAKKILPEYQADKMLIFFYAGNDLTDVAYRKDFTPNKRTYEVVFKETEELLSKEEVRVTKDRFSEFDWEAFEEGGVDPQMIKYAQNRIENPASIGRHFVNPHILNLGIWKSDYLYDNLTLKNNISQYGWYRALMKLGQLSDLAFQYHCELSLVVIPSNVQVDTSHYSLYRKCTFNVKDDLLFANDAQRILYEFCKTSNIKFVDLLPHFKSAENHAELYFENDDHLSEEGHLLAFRVLENELLKDIVKDTVILPNSEGSEYYRNFESSLVKRQMDIIRADSLWFQNIVRKSAENGLSVDSQLELDARYILHQ